MNEKKPVGVIIIGILLILSSAVQIFHIPSFARYVFLNRELPENIIKLRFLISYAMRIVGLVAGVGLLCFSEIFRKIVWWFAIFLIVTLYWRHTYSAFLIYTAPVYRQAGITEYSLEVFTWIAVIIRWVIDGCFSAFLLYYLTRPGVLRHFR